MNYSTSMPWNPDNGNPFILDSDKVTEPIHVAAPAVGEVDENSMAFLIGKLTAYALIVIIGTAAISFALAILFITVSALANVIGLIL